MTATTTSAALPDATALNPETLPAFAAQALTLLRARTPLVQSITNTVVANFTANVLLALGAAPAMVDIPREAGPFARMASGLLINLGTPVPSQAEAVMEAACAAAEAGTPWVLDPVAIGSLPVRTALAAQLLQQRPSAVRGNASEILAAAGCGAGGRGVDATASVAQAEQAAMQLAAASGAVVAVSGPVDFLTDGQRQIRLANGTPLLTKVTGGGCALGSVMAAFLSLANSRAEHLPLAAAAVLVYTIAAEMAAEQVARQQQGPGSFAVQFIDRLALITAHDVLTHARVLGIERAGAASVTSSVL
ncbi:hydroxyethylthiazole kinase [Comamonadaceae bacterium OH2310_COT-174]|nr:hydroxyethylthiazole kinase [Comamonadaceae bacterium OH2310_COT-174]